MRDILLVVSAAFLAAVLAIGIIGASTVQVDKAGCREYTITSTSSDYYFPTGGRDLVVNMEGDVTGNVAGTQTTWSGCSDNDANQCKAYPFDTNYDGVPDSNVLDGNSFPLNKRWHTIRGVAGGVIADTTAFAAVGKITVCGIK
jgi:hypothetical protein